MRRIICSTYMSLDGVIQRPEQWTFDYRSDDATQASHDQLFEADALLMGRGTYDIFAAHWPGADDNSGFAERMNAIPKYVVSTTLTEPAWNNTSVLSGDHIAAQIKALKQLPGEMILQYGYGPITALLIREGLLDELRLWLHPLLVGSDDPAAHLSAASATGRFRLANSTTYDSGLVILRYESATARE